MTSNALTCFLTLLSSNFSVQFNYKLNVPVCFLAEQGIYTIKVKNFYFSRSALNRTLAILFLLHVPTLSLSLDLMELGCKSDLWPCLLDRIIGWYLSSNKSPTIFYFSHSLCFKEKKSLAMSTTSELRLWDPQITIPHTLYNISKVYLNRNGLDFKIIIKKISNIVLIIYRKFLYLYYEFI